MQPHFKSLPEAKHILCISLHNHHLSTHTEFVQTHNSVRLRKEQNPKEGVRISCSEEAVCGIWWIHSQITWRIMFSLPHNEPFSQRRWIIPIRVHYVPSTVVVLSFLFKSSLVSYSRTVVGQASRVPGFVHRCHFTFSYFCFCNAMVVQRHGFIVYTKDQLFALKLANRPKWWLWWENTQRRCRVVKDESWEREEEISFIPLCQVFDGDACIF